MGERKKESETSVFDVQIYSVSIHLPATTALGNGDCLSSADVFDGMAAGIFTASAILGAFTATD